MNKSIIKKTRLTLAITSTVGVAYQTGKHNPDEVGVFRDEDLPPAGLNAVDRAIWPAPRTK